MIMKKTYLIISIVLVQLLLISSAQARCNLELFRFGSSVQDIEKQLNLDEGGMLPIMGGESQEVLFVPGEEVCKGEKAFEGAPVTFVFLYDKLVEIQTVLLSEKPTLVHWAESIYGDKQDKPKSFFNDKPNAQWLWDNFNATIAYSIRPDANDVIESIIIQSRRHQRYFEKFAKEEEQSLQGDLQ
jgi:hypothetical protein